MADPLALHRHRFVPATDPAARGAVLALHGTGGDETSLIGLAQTVFPGAAVLSPRGNVLEAGAPRFFRRHAEGVLDLEDLAVRTGEMADFVAAAAQHYGFDPGTLAAIGFSNGANLAVSLLLTRPGVLNAAALLSPMLPFVPADPIRLDGTAVFIGAGNLDPLVPAAQIDQLQAILTDAGAVVTMHREETGHTVTDREVVAAQEWAKLLA